MVKLPLQMCTLTLYAGSLNIVTMDSHHSIVAVEIAGLSTMGRDHYILLHFFKFHTLSVDELSVKNICLKKADLRFCTKW